MKVGLGDGSQVILATFSCWLDWFGEEKEIQVVGSSGQFPLLGVGLLRGRRVFVDYRSGTLTIE